ncbi:uncharacterized protein LOC141779336 isoform X2 [Sebastes fasciatus]|uniref:uncharacterized protein LOC141779336 isoform X2 n=1 Tax=Sebastes fasciatus TaxID=394691 RepID=UPI003D9EBF1A
MPYNLRTRLVRTPERPSSSRNLVCQTVDPIQDMLDNRSGGNQRATKRKSDESHERAIKTSRTSQGNFNSAEDAGTSTPACASISSKSEEKKGRKRRFEDTEAYGKRKRTFMSPNEGTSYQATTETTPEAIPETIPDAIHEATPETSFRSGSDTLISTNSEEKKGRKRKSEDTGEYGKRRKTPLSSGTDTSYQGTNDTTTESTPETIPETTSSDEFDTSSTQNSREIFDSDEDTVSWIPASTDSEEKKSRKRKSEDTGDYGNRRRTSLNPSAGTSYPWYQAPLRYLSNPFPSLFNLFFPSIPETIPKAIPETIPEATAETIPEATSSDSDTTFPEATLFHNRADFEAKYEEEGMLGQGSFGAVFAGHRKDDHLPVAIKRIREFLYTKVDLDGEVTDLPTEVALLLYLNPAGAGTSAVVGLLDWYNLDNELILVLERPVPCMDLYDYLVSIQLSIQEDMGRIITKQLVEGLQEVHSREVFHRDIKMENILIETGSDVPRVWIIDFGSGEFLTEERYTENEGTLLYTTPEYIRRGWSTPEATTVWQLGAVLFEMLHDGVTPFHTPRDIINAVPDIRDTLSYNCQDFIARCMDKSPEARPTLETLKHHPWLV